MNDLVGGELLLRHGGLPRRGGLQLPVVEAVQEHLTYKY